MTDAIKRSQGYQIFLVLILSLNFGILFFDRNALNFLMPFVQPDLGLTRKSGCFPPVFRSLGR
jgi:MFS transporter, ACS family, hexuronate transporter